MSRPVVLGLDEAAATIPDGATIAPGGFMLSRAPMALVFALVRHARRDLRVVSLPNPLPAEILVAAGALSRVDFLFAALSLGGKVRSMPCLKRAIETDAIEWAEHDGYRLVQALRAASMGLPFLPVPDFGGSSLAAHNPLPIVVDPFTGESVHVERALRIAQPVIGDLAERFHDIGDLGVLVVDATLLARFEIGGQGLAALFHDAGEVAGKLLQVGGAASVRF